MLHGYFTEIKYTVNVLHLNLLETIPAPAVEKLSSTKPVSGAKRLGTTVLDYQVRSMVFVRLDSIFASLWENGCLGIFSFLSRPLSHYLLDSALCSLSPFPF